MKGLYRHIADVCYNISPLKNVLELSENVGHVWQVVFSQLSLMHHVCAQWAISTLPLPMKHNTVLLCRGACSLQYEYTWLEEDHFMPVKPFVSSTSILFNLYFKIRSYDVVKGQGWGSELGKYDAFYREYCLSLKNHARIFVSLIFCLLSRLNAVAAIGVEIV